MLQTILNSFSLEGEYICIDSGKNKKKMHIMFYEPEAVWEWYFCLFSDY